MLKDIFQDFVMDFGGQLYQYLLLCEVAYKNSYHSSVDMASFEALYRSLIGWFDAFEVRPWGTNMLKDLMEKVRLSQEKVIAA